MKTTTTLLAGIALLAAACAEPPSASPPSTASPAPAAGHPPVASPHGEAAPAAGPGLPAAHFKAPEGWQAEKPSSSMRLLQYRLPRADGDAEDGEVAVFAGSMGTPAANIERWRGQFSGVEHGRDKIEEVKEGVKGPVHLLDIAGQFGGGMGGGAAPHGGSGKGLSRMIAAVVEHPAGAFYVKALGPPATLGKWESSIRAFILDAAKR